MFVSSSESEQLEYSSSFLLVMDKSDNVLSDDGKKQSETCYLRFSGKQYHLCLKWVWEVACDHACSYPEWPTLLEFLEFLELFWNFFGTGNVLEKSHFFRLVLELFWNSEFLTSDFLGYNISSCPLFGSPICEKILFQFGRPCVLEKSENVLEMFLDCSGIFLKILLATL